MVNVLKTIMFFNEQYDFCDIFTPFFVIIYFTDTGGSTQSMFVKWICVGYIPKNMFSCMCRFKAWY